MGKLIAFEANQAAVSKKEFELAVFQKVMRNHGYYLDIQHVPSIMADAKLVGIQMVLQKYEGDKSKISENFIKLIHTDLLRALKQSKF